MMKRIYIYLFGAVLLAFVSSCSSTKNMRKSVSIGNLSETEYMTEVFNRAPAWDAFDGKDVNGCRPERKGSYQNKRHYPHEA